MMSIRDNAVEEAAKMLQSKGFSVDTEDIYEMRMIAHEIQEEKPLMEMASQLFDIFYRKRHAKRDLDFALAVSAKVEEMGGMALNNDDVIALLQYRNEFESSGQNVWDGTRDEHYAKWILNHWRAPRADEIETKSIHFTYKTPDGNADAIPQTEMAKYVRTFVAFGGADAILMINGTPVGEAQEVKWTKNLRVVDPTEKPVRGELHLVIFDREPIRKLLERERTTMCIVYANEYGQRAYQPITNPVFTDFKGGISIDNIVQTVTYFFEADDVEMRPFDGPIMLDNGDYNPIFDE